MLKIVEHNPYRILGVYSNAKPAEIVSNCDDMEAYLSIGQSVSFDLDLNNLISDVERTAGSVVNARKQINLPKDKLKYALFWFIKDSSSTHALNYLKNGDFNNADSVFEIEDSFSTRINQAMVAMLQDDLGAAISFVTEMIHDNDGLGFRDDFVRAICGDAFSITEENLAHLYIDTLLEEVDVQELLELFEENGVSEEDDDYLRGKAIDEPISKINAEIAKAKGVKRDDADANLQAGKVLMETTKNDLAMLKELLGTSDMKYQMLADDLANTILQCGINYYNNTDDDDDIANAMVLQKYACKIAVGKMCKDRCNSNLAVLEKKMDEQAIKTDVNFIANKLAAFQTKSSTIQNAEDLVKDCIPYLNNIKNQLGSQNNTYLQISSAVANNSLGMLVAVINNAQNALIPSQSSLNALLTKINSAISVMNQIGGLDMTPAERSHFNTNKSSLNNIKLQVNSLLSHSSSTSSYNGPYGNTKPSSGGEGSDTNWGCIIMGIIAFIILIISLLS
jgi:hypothetical protein